MTGRNEHRVHQWCGQDHEHTAIAAWEACGCLAGVSVITHSEPEAYKFAATEAKAGLRIETAEVEELKARPWKCPDHPKGPPWWKSNGGKGKRPAEYAPTVGMGL